MCCAGNGCKKDLKRSFSETVDRFETVRKRLFSKETVSCVGEPNAPLGNPFLHSVTQTRPYSKVDLCLGCERDLSATSFFLSLHYHLFLPSQHYHHHHYYNFFATNSPPSPPPPPLPSFYRQEYCAASLCCRVPARTTHFRTKLQAKHLSANGTGRCPLY